MISHQPVLLTVLWTLRSYQRGEIRRRLPGGGEIELAHEENTNYDLLGVGKPSRQKESA